MIKSILILSALLFAGCATKTTVQKPAPYYKPITPKQPIQQAPNNMLGEVAPLPQNGIDGNMEPIEIEVSPQLNNAKSYVTTFKTQQFSFSDAGFMREENGVIDLQILALGKPLLNLKVADDICVDHHCRTKQEFNENYLSPDYPEDLINKVLTSQVIFEGQGLKQTSNGFLQRIKSPLYDIKYKITPGSIYFKDLKNNIIIKLRELQ